MSIRAASNRDRDGDGDAKEKARHTRAATTKGSRRVISTAQPPRLRLLRLSEVLSCLFTYGNRRRIFIISSIFNYERERLVDDGNSVYKVAVALL